MRFVLTFALVVSALSVQTASVSSADANAFLRNQASIDVNLRTGDSDSSLSAVEPHSFRDASPPAFDREELIAAAQNHLDRELSWVFPPDDRVRLSPADPRVALILQFYDDGDGVPEAEDIAGHCTASFVGPRLLLTAAHCLFIHEEGGWPDAVLVVPGADGSSTPYGSYVMYDAVIPSIWVDDRDFAFDFGFMLLEALDSVGSSTGTFPLAALTDASLAATGLTPTTIGYPGDKPPLTQWLATAPGIAGADSQFVVHFIDHANGQSGSPIFRAADQAVFAVVSASGTTDGGDQFNVARRIHTDVIDFALSYCDEVGCDFDYFVENEEPQPPPSEPDPTPPSEPDPSPSPSPNPNEMVQQAMQMVWERTDMPIAQGLVSRTWIWGPAPVTQILIEPYVEAPGGNRAVLYHEKSRMEVTNPNGDPNSIWYVTNGLAVEELMTGRLQLGDNTFEQHNPAQINVAGDQNDPNGPTYATFAGLRQLPPHGGVPQGSGVGPVITATVNRAGTVGDDPALASYGVTADYYAPETGHRVATPFWQFMNSSGTVYQNGQYVTDALFDNPFFATGYPITEAYWTTVQVGGTPRTVLVQAFQRRVLTYTPGNSDGFVVEAGNVGAHYYHWRYELIPDEVPNEPPPGNGGEEPIDPPPALGELLFGTDMSNAPPLETERGDIGTPLESSYRISNPPGGALSLYAEGTYGDAFYTLDSRVLQPSTMGLVCLMFRMNYDQTGTVRSGYWLCLRYEGSALASIDVVYVTPQTAVPIGGWETVQMVPAGEWRQFGIVAQGQRFWVVIDGTPIGSFEHDLGPSTGEAGLMTFNVPESSSNAVFELTNYGIFALAGSSTSALAGSSTSALAHGLDDGLNVEETFVASRASHTDGFLVQAHQAFVGPPVDGAHKPMLFERRS